jgi:hypothetical protein
MWRRGLALAGAAAPKDITVKAKSARIFTAARNAWSGLSIARN